MKSRTPKVPVKIALTKRLKAIAKIKVIKKFL